MLPPVAREGEPDRAQLDGGSPKDTFWARESREGLRWHTNSRRSDQDPKTTGDPAKTLKPRGSREGLRGIQDRPFTAAGLPTGVLQMPIRMEKGVFLNLELSVTDPTALRAAAEAYMQDAAKAEEYLTYAEGAQLQGDSESIRAYLDSAFAAAKRCQTSLQRVLAQLPAGPST